MRFTRHSKPTTRELESIMKGRREEEVLTFITDFGFVQGVPTELKENRYSDLKTRSDDAACRSETYNFTYIKEVIIHSFEGELIKVDHLVIYDEQLIGIIPGKLYEPEE
ncbi:hypothetical protein SAMN05421743_12120 [Thalassobacillus cyri]|uniref:Uncharacterized protein n=1 Tax=Thalassobacillus cyri TaxID=571932 RepID=A0A1H4H1E1_9BACI|nr:hypothetical protein [Thalassobacillus cyri]SEB15584.1 hypothetical protein SAMN05421743_12120 [Thalassobacillus cyri]